MVRLQYCNMIESRDFVASMLIVVYSFFFVSPQYLAERVGVSIANSLRDSLNISLNNFQWVLFLEKCRFIKDNLNITKYVHLKLKNTLQPSKENEHYYNTSAILN